MTIIEQIRAEIIKRIDKRRLSEQAKNELVSLLSLLSDLEKEWEEKPKKGLHHGSLRKVDNPMKWMEDDAKELTNLTVKEQPVKSNIVEDLKHYLATTPKEQIEKDWESLKEWDKVGPSVSEFLGWEQPVCEGFDGEFSKFSNDVDAEHPFPICVDEFKDFARHFYELGRQSKPKVCEECPSRGNTHSYLKGLEDGKKEMREQMMKEIEDANDFEKVLADVFQSATTMVSSPPELVDAFKERLLRSAFKCFAEKKALRQSLFAKQFLELPDEIKAVIERIAQDSSHAFCDSFATLVAANKGYRKGQHDMKERMMKEAEETELYWDGDFLAIDLNMAELGYSERDKVRIIILPKEDEK